MIDKDVIASLLGAISAKNVVGVGMELKPYELASLMVKSLDNSEEYGYIVMGVSKLINNYRIEGVNLTVNHAKVPIATAMKLLSHDLELEYDSISINGKDIFVIKLKNNGENPQLKFNKDINSENGFIKNLVVACTYLQTRPKYYGEIKDGRFFNCDEDERNDYIADLLGAAGYDVKDQTRRGYSSTGKAAGEVDIFISKDRLPFTVIEAMNLTSVNTSYINTHLDKIFFYDMTGTKFNVCLSYVTAINFESFWEKYSSHVIDHEYPSPFIRSDKGIDDDFGYSELRLMKTIHNRSGKNTTLYHICVKIPTPKKD
jgi:hypothetical protein